MFSDTLKSKREESGLSFDVLALRSRTSPAYLHRLERGTANRPGRNMVIRIGVSLGLDVDGIDELLTDAGHLPLVSTTPNSPTQHI